jgi:hypothetical protein
MVALIESPSLTRLERVKVFIGPQGADGYPKREDVTVATSDGGPAVPFDRLESLIALFPEEGTGQESFRISRRTLALMFPQSDERTIPSQWWRSIDSMPIPKYPSIKAFNRNTLFTLHENTRQLQELAAARLGQPIAVLGSEKIDFKHIQTPRKTLYMIASLSPASAISLMRSRKLTSLAYS